MKGVAYDVSGEMGGGAPGGKRSKNPGATMRKGAPGLAVKASQTWGKGRTPPQAFKRRCT